MKRKIISALAVIGALLFLAAPGAQAARGDTVGWYSNNCNTNAGTVMNMNIKVYWGVNDDRRVYFSASDHFPDPPYIYEGVDDIAIYAKAPGGTWVQKADIQPGPDYGTWDTRVISHLNLANPGLNKYWQLHVRWTSQICYSQIVVN
jgi:hypothetical protein